MLYLQYVNITYYVILTYPFLMCIGALMRNLTVGTVFTFWCLVTDCITMDHARLLVQYANSRILA